MSTEQKRKELAKISKLGNISTWSNEKVNGRYDMIVREHGDIDSSIKIIKEGESGENITD